MRSVGAKLFVAVIGVALVALALGALWVSRTVAAEFGPRVEVERTVQHIDGKDIVTETSREVTPEAGTPQPRVVDAGALTRRLIVAFAVVLVGAALATTLVARRVLGPVRALHAAARLMAEGDRSLRVAVGGRDEVAALAGAFNTLADALAAQERRKRDLTNDVAHELRTPLTDLRCHLEALQDGVVPMSAEALATLHSEVVHLQRLVDDLGELARAEAREVRLEPELVDLSEPVTQAIRQVSPRAATLGVTLRAEAAAGAVRAWVDRGRVQQIIGNLLDNALVHTPAGGEVVVRASQTETMATIQVTDTGPGIAAEHLPFVFDRLYRADPSRSRATGGVGLGLAIARQLAEASGGRIDVASPPGQGATFTVTLPRERVFTNPS